jgi:hypothetical protein
MALVWGGSDWVRQGSDTESEAEARSLTPSPSPPVRVVYRCGTDADTLEVAVVLVVFHRVVRHFGVSRYRFPF